MADDRPRDEALIEEFDRLGWFVARSWAGYIKRNDLPLELEDLHQEALYALLRRGSELDEIEGRDARGLKALRIMSSWVGSKIESLRWRKSRPDDGRELVPIIGFGGDGDSLSLLVVDPEDFDYTDLDVTLQMLMPDREYRMLKRLEEGKTWSEIGVEFGYSGSPMRAGQSAHDAVRAVLTAAGIKTADDLLSGEVAYEPDEWRALMTKRTKQQDQRLGRTRNRAGSST